MRNKKIIIPAFALGVLMLAGALWVGKTAAQAVAPSQSVADKLAERFSLNKDEVTSVFDEVWQEREQKRQAHMEQRLDEAVKDGVITAEQKQALLNKNVEMQEKQRQMNEEMRKWREESGIDFEKLAQYRVGFGGPGFGGRGFGKGHWPGGF